MMNNGLADLVTRIERDNERIEFAINSLSLDLETKRRFVNRRIEARRDAYEQIRQLTSNETEIVPAVKPQKGQMMQSREDMARARKNARLSYATWLFAVTRMQPGPGQVKIATSCFKRLGRYYDQLKEIIGEEQAEEALGALFNEVHEVAAMQAEAERAQPVIELQGVRAQLV